MDKKNYIVGIGFFLLAVTNALFVGEHSPLMLVLFYGALFLPYLFFLHAAKHGRWSWKEILLLGFSIRIACAFIDPVLSDDIFRYVWEGRANLAGLSPFANPPNADSLFFLRDEEIWPLINHKEIPAIYPPFAQGFFTLIALFQGGTVAVKLGFITIEALTIYALFRILKGTWTRNRMEYALAIYVLNPLVIYEVAWSGHLDVLAWSPLVLCLSLLVYRSKTRWVVLAGVLLGLSISAKFIGLILLPLILFARRKPVLSRSTFLQQRVAFIIVVFSTLALTYTPFLKQGHLFDGFGAYASSWKNNEGYFRIFERVASRAMYEPTSEVDPILRFPQHDALAMSVGFTKVWEGKTIPNTSFGKSQITGFIAKAIGGLAMGCFLLLLLFIRRDLLTASLLLILFLYMVAPTTMPWYIGWLVPLAALTKHKPSILFSFLVLLGYTSWISIRSGGVWAIPDWVVFVEYFLLTIALIIFPNVKQE